MPAGLPTENLRHVVILCAAAVAVAESLLFYKARHALPCSSLAAKAQLSAACGVNCMPSRQSDGSSSTVAALCLCSQKAFAPGCECESSPVGLPFHAALQALQALHHSGGCAWLLVLYVGQRGT